VTDSRTDKLSAHYSKIATKTKPISHVDIWFDVHRPHRCPEPKKRNSAPTGIMSRLYRRSVITLTLFSFVCALLCLKVGFIMAYVFAKLFVS